MGNMAEDEETEDWGVGGGGWTSLTKMEWIMKGSSWEVRDDGGSFRARKSESKEGMEREASYGTAEEGPQWENS